MGGTQTLCHRRCAIGFQVSQLGACLISNFVDLNPAAACPLIHNVSIWDVRRIARYAMYKTCQTLRNVMLSHLLLKVLSWCVFCLLCCLIHCTELQLHLISKSAVGLVSKTPKCTLSDCCSVLCAFQPSIYCNLQNHILWNYPKLLALSVQDSKRGSLWKCSRTGDLSGQA